MRLEGREIGLTITHRGDMRLLDDEQRQRQREAAGLPKEPQKK